MLVVRRSGIFPMPTVRDRIIAYLRTHPEGATDDDLADALKLKQRQQANSRCRQLESEGLIERRRVNGTIHNFVTGDSAMPIVEDESINQDDRPWFWEGNVQESVIEHLKKQGYSITRTANTATREPGKDIVASKGVQVIWVTVKGFPEGTTRTQPSTQAGHWFKQGLFDVLAWRGENRDAEIAYALPDYPRYRKLAEKIKWLQPIVRFSFFWVRENGITREPAE